MKNIIRPLKTIVLALVIGLSIGYVMAWSAPTAPPPGANVPAPVNVGSTGGKLGSMQYKSDGFAVGGLFQTDSDTYLAVKGGKVGIGTDNPQSALDVRGGMNVNGKMTVSTGSSVSYTPALWGITADGYLKVCDLDGGNCALKDSVGGTGNSVVFGGSLWIGGWGPSNAGNLYQCDNDGKCQNKGNKTTGRKILAMTSFGDSLWLGDSSGYLYKCDTAGTCSNEGDKGGSITAMTADSANLWIGHSGGSVKKCDDAGSCVQTFAFGNVSALARSGNALFVGINGSPAKVRACDITTKVCNSRTAYNATHITAMVNSFSGVLVASASEPGYDEYGGQYQTNLSIFYCNATDCEAFGSPKSALSNFVGIIRSMTPEGFAGLTSWDRPFYDQALISCDSEYCRNISVEAPPTFGLAIFDKTVYTPTKSVTMSDGGLTTRNFSLNGTYPDLNMRRLIDGDTTWKRALVAYPDKLILNYSNDFSKGVETQGNMTVGGNMNAGGNMIVGGGVLQMTGTDKATWPTCTQSIAGQIRFNGTDQIRICKYLSIYSTWVWGGF